MKTTDLTPEQTARLVAHRLNGGGDPVVDAFNHIVDLYGVNNHMSSFFKACERHVDVYCHHPITEVDYYKNELFILLCKKSVAVLYSKPSIKVGKGYLTEVPIPEHRFLDEAIENIKNKINNARKQKDLTVDDFSMYQRKGRNRW